MKKTFKELKREARAALKGKWGEGALLFFVLLLFAFLCDLPSGYYQITHPDYQQDLLTYGLQWSFFKFIIPTSLLGLFVFYPLAVGASNSFRVLLAGDKNLVDNSFKMGFGNYLHNVGGMFFMMLFIFLWSLLLVIPGIIKAFAYAMTPFVLVDNPELSCYEAIKRSQELMKGNKWRYFLLALSFLGWILLGILTLGIGFFWITPYIETTIAAFYNDIKAQKGL